MTTLREKYFANEILKIGDIVEDSSSGEQYKIIDRGSNYITVDGASGVMKKWLNEVKYTETVETKPETDFTITETGQLKMFGYDTKSFDRDLSELIVEQFGEFEDLYSKHQIVKLLDSAITETNKDKQYDLLEKVSSFYSKNNIGEPVIVEAMKNDLERRRIVEILATVAGSPVDKSAYKTATDAVKALREKYTKRSQWEVLWPFLKLAKAAGITGITQNLPFNLDTKDEQDPKIGVVHEQIIELMEENFDELLISFDVDDILETFEESELTDEFLSEEQLNEVLTFDTRIKLGRIMKAHSVNLTTKRARAMTRSASTDVLQARARRLAETLIKRRMFRKAPADMTRQEKERFEKGASRRKALVAKLAQRLIGKVRMIQSTRIHAQHAAAATPHAGNQVGAA